MLGALAALVLASGCGWLVGVSGDVSLAPDGDAGLLDATGGGVDAPSDRAVAVEAADDAADADPGDPPRDAALHDSGLVPDPGIVGCGAGTCTLAQKVCCYQPDAAPSCGAAAQCAGGGEVSQCDETADCVGGICCLDVQSFGVESACQSRCSGTQVQGCRTSAECPKGVPCIAWTCGTLVLGTCGGKGANSGCDAG
jgi:hypothetical protein